ncbi:YheT family hydrolase [Fulvivirga sedimenti]|uniref:Alpha/beta fold hydrolase n=1 Tax=Fulvivirga sedimenti TaxID=2879465 RepID=A0A9X1KZW5_9BACT|nr:alpha/beta fold hydrolase [Fulvivirga sedimenti]MCA6078755.1 alpha/beta fold hydrolase [Fulvivirga sedimenti]
MPVVKSSYRSPFWLRHPHLATIIPSMYRKVEGVRYERERIDTPDGDFLDLDWLRQGSRKLVILSHGLEGSSGRGYMKGVARHFYNSGWDALSWNCRSCSGEINRLPRFYHHADIEDIGLVIDQALPAYEEVYLVGFSMGGNMILNYLGRLGNSVSEKVRGGVVFSVPLLLKSSVNALSTRSNRMYRERFIKKLGEKIRLKSELFPEVISDEGYEEIEQFPDFDNRYTAPLHGFKDAEDFYEKASPLRYLSGVKRPVLIVNAANDPFLGPECYPVEVADNLANIYLEIPKRGGHVGFVHRKLAHSYMEVRALEFFNEIG